MTIKVNFPKTTPASILNQIKARQNKFTSSSPLLTTPPTGVSAGQIFTLYGGATGSTSANITLTYGNTVASTDPFITRHEYIVIKTDLLAMSCARFRLLENTGILNEDLAKLVIAEDHDMAANIRRYYTDKCIIWKLKDKQLTDFRRDMYTFLSTDGTKFEEKMVTLAYCLPEFYTYDLAFDEIRQGRNIDFTPEEFKKHQQSKEELILRLEPIRRLHRRTNSKNQYEYWMNDAENHLYVLCLNPNNSLLPLWEKIFAKDHLVINGYYWLRMRNDTPCFYPQRWEIVE